MFSHLRCLPEKHCAAAAAGPCPATPLRHRLARWPDRAAQGCPRAPAGLPPLPSPVSAIVAVGRVGGPRRTAAAAEQPPLRVQRRFRASAQQWRRSDSGSGAVRRAAPCTSRHLRALALSVSAVSVLFSPSPGLFSSFFGWCLARARMTLVPRPPRARRAASLPTDLGEHRRAALPPRPFRPGRQLPTRKAAASDPEGSCRRVLSDPEELPTLQVQR